MALIDFLYTDQILEMFRKGIQTEHFCARVSYPYGFDCPPKISLKMTPFEIMGDEEESALDLMESNLKEELFDLRTRIYDLTSEIRTFSFDRDMVRKNKNPEHGYHTHSCFRKVYHRKEAAV